MVATESKKFCNNEMNIIFIWKTSEFYKQNQQKWMLYDFDIYCLCNTNSRLGIFFNYILRIEFISSKF